MPVLEVPMFAVPKIPNQTSGNVSFAVNRLNTSKEALFLVIQAPKTGTIQRVFFKKGTVLTAGNIRCTLEGIGADGRPNNILLVQPISQPPILLPGSDATKFIVGSGGWDFFALQAPAFVTKGQKFAIGFHNPESSFGDIEINTCTKPEGNVFPYVLTRATNGSYVGFNHIPVVSLEYNDTTYPRILEGTTFVGAIPAQAGDILESGLKFKLNFNTRISGFWTCFGEGSLTNEFRLYDDGNQTLVTKITTYGNVSVGFIRQYIFGSQIPIFKNKYYRLIVRKNAGAITPCGGLVISPEFSEGIDGGVDFLYTERNATSEAWVDKLTSHPLMGIFCDQLDVDTFGGTGFIPPTVPNEAPLVTSWFPDGRNIEYLETPPEFIYQEQGVYYT